MIIDSHCHAWPLWPYQPPVPDDTHRGKIEQLLNEMELNGVDQSMLVCAQIDRNPRNNDYIAQQVSRYPTRLHQIVDHDSEWSSTYHQPGSADRLQAMIDQWPIKGFTHYLAAADDGSWLYSDEGQRVFKIAEKYNLIVSLSTSTHHQPAIRRAAEMFPTVSILIHHMGWVKVDEAEPREGLKQVLESAKIPNIYLKFSGFAYATHPNTNWDYPYTDTHDIFRAEYEHFGAERMCWGSDYPVVRFFMTYRQSLEAFRQHCTFIPEADKAQILGGTLERLLNAVKVTSST